MVKSTVEKYCMGSYLVVLFGDDWCNCDLIVIVWDHMSRQKSNKSKVNSSILRYSESVMHSESFMTDTENKLASGTEVSHWNHSVSLHIFRVSFVHWFCNMQTFLLSSFSINFSCIWKTTLSIVPLRHFFWFWLLFWRSKLPVSVWGYVKYLAYLS